MLDYLFSDSSYPLLGYFSVVEVALKLPFFIRDIFSAADSLIFAIAETSRYFSSAISKVSLAFYVAFLAAIMTSGLTFLEILSFFATV